MSVELVTLVPISGESFAALQFAVVVRGYKFRDARKSIDTSRYDVTQVDKQVAGPDVCRIATNGHR